MQVTDTLQNILSKCVCKCRKVSGPGGTRLQKLSESKAATLPVFHSHSLSFSLPLPHSLPLSQSISISIPLSTSRNTWSFFCMAALSFSLSRSAVFVCLHVYRAVDALYLPSTLIQVTGISESQFQGSERANKIAPTWVRCPPTPQHGLFSPRSHGHVE